MDCTVTGQTVTVILSRRNLLAFLHKLDEMEGSALTITRDTENGWEVRVHAEPDSVHYADREPGTMHPLTEAYITKRT